MYNIYSCRVLNIYTGDCKKQIVDSTTEYNIM